MDLKAELIINAKNLHESLNDSKKRVNDHLLSRGYKSDFLTSYIERINETEELISMWGCSDLKEFIRFIKKSDIEELKSKLQKKHLRFCLKKYKHKYEMHSFILFNKKYLELTNSFYKDDI